MTRRKVGVLLSATALAVAAAGTAVVQLPPFPAAAAPSMAASNVEVAARIGDHIITMRDVDDQWRQDHASERLRALQAVYDGRKAAMHRLIASVLIEDAARAAGRDGGEFAEAEIGRRLGPIGDEDVLAFYMANRDRLERPFEELHAPIRAALDRQQRERAYTALVADLRKAGPPVTVRLDAPRQPVPIADADPAQGRDDAPVTIVVFSDFQCPFCARVAPTLEQVRAAYGADVRVIWKDFPLTSIHPRAFEAAEASHCAAEQDRYWQYHRALFDNQAAQEESDLVRYAREIGLDTARFDACLGSAKYAKRVRDDLDAGTTLGVQATPTLFINGRFLDGAQPFEAIAALVDEELERPASY